MARSYAPRDPLAQFLGAGVASQIDLGVTDDRIIVDDWCGPLHSSELSLLLGALDRELAKDPFDWERVSKDSVRYFKNERDTRNWLLSIRHLVAQHFETRTASEGA